MSKSAKSMEQAASSEAESVEERMERLELLVAMQAEQLEAAKAATAEAIASAKDASTAEFELFGQVIGGRWTRPEWLNGAVQYSFGIRVQDEQSRDGSKVWWVRKTFSEERAGMPAGSPSGTAKQDVTWARVRGELRLGAAKIQKRGKASAEWADSIKLEDITDLSFGPLSEFVAEAESDTVSSL